MPIYTPKLSKKEIGKLGEDIAAKFLEAKGFAIIERNYFKKWGELDVIAWKDKTLHIVEVKTVTREKKWSSEAGFSQNYNRENRGNGDISRETSNFEGEEYSPEENVHPQKLKRISRVTQSYLLEKCPENQEWQFDVIAVFLNLKDKKAICRYTEDVVL